MITKRQICFYLCYKDVLYFSLKCWNLRKQETFCFNCLLFKTNILKTIEMIFLITHVNIETTIVTQEYFTFQSKNLCWTYFFPMEKITTCFESQKKILSEGEKQIISYLEVSIFYKWERVLSFKFEGKKQPSAWNSYKIVICAITGKCHPSVKLAWSIHFSPLS